MNVPSLIRNLLQGVTHLQILDTMIFFHIKTHQNFKVSIQKPSFIKKKKKKVKLHHYDSSQMFHNSLHIQNQTT